MSLYPEVVIFVAPEPDGRLAPVVATVEGLALPIVRGSIDFDPNGTVNGTRALTATLVLQVGSGSGIEEIESAEAIPERVVSLPELQDDTVADLLEAIEGRAPIAPDDLARVLAILVGASARDGSTDATLGEAIEILRPAVESNLVEAR